ncbi:hypothetical protein Trydic_g2746 [Trypoxylus dichotomus]
MTRLIYNIRIVLLELCHSSSRPDPARLSTLSEMELREPVLKIAFLAVTVTVGRAVDRWSFLGRERRLSGFESPYRVDLEASHGGGIATTAHFDRETYECDANGQSVLYKVVNSLFLTPRS